MALFALGEVVNCAWLAAAVQPVILSLGAIFAALDLDLQPMLDAQPIEFRNFFIFGNKENANKELEDIRLTDEEK